MFNQRTIQPGAADLRVCIHAEDSNKSVTSIGKLKSLRGRNDTLSQRGTHVRLPLAKEADMMGIVTVQADNEAD